MSRMLAIVMGVCLLLGITPGCGPHVSDEDLGEVQTTVEDLPGAGEKYVLPKPEFPEGEGDPEAGEEV